MKSRLYAVLALAVALSGCATAEGKVAIGRGASAAQKVDYEAVQSMIDDNREDAARYYLTKAGLSEAEIIVAVEKAKKAKKEAAARAAAQAAALAAKE